MNRRNQSLPVLQTPRRLPLRWAWFCLYCGIFGLAAAGRLGHAAEDPVASGPQVFLIPDVLMRVRSLPETQASQWQAFKRDLDKNLNVVIAGDYQASNLFWLSNYAFGYKVLQERDPATASKYADKAIAVLKSALHEYQKGGWNTRQFLARGDGETRAFTLPHDDIVPASVHVYTGKVDTKPLVRNSKETHDTAVYYSHFLKVSDTADGPADYVEGQDWKHNPLLPNNTIDWAAARKQPATGTTYYLTTTSAFGAAPMKFRMSVHRIELAKAPAKDQTVFVEYVYGKQSADGSTLGFQQTSANDGGFNSITIDATYTSRHLGKNVAIGLDWLDGYKGFTAALKQEAVDTLIRWSDFIRDFGYIRDSPASNYGVGGYVSRVYTALALAHRHPDGPRLIEEVLGYRRKNVLPLLANPITSLKGGFWVEGWSYGSLATQNLLLAGMALEAGGHLKATEERAWAAEAIRQLVSAQPSKTTIYDGGDWFSFPAPFPGKSLFYVLAAAVSDETARSYANFIIKNYAGAPVLSYVELIFRDPKATSGTWTNEPLQYFASGGGLLTARSDWGPAPIFVAMQLGNLLVADHQSYTPGQLQIQRGGDGLLINAACFGNDQNAYLKSTYGNIILADDEGEKMQTYRFAMGVSYGTPGVFISAYEADKRYVYMGGDYHAAYSSRGYPGKGGPTSELTRQMVYLRPDTIIVFDRAATVKDTYLKRLQWHFLNLPVVTENAFVASAGQSKLFGQTFSTVLLTTETAKVKVENKYVHQVRTKNEKPITSLRYVTAFQVARKTDREMTATRHLLSADSLMEGTQIGDQVVLFGRDGPIAAGKSIRYEVDGKDAVQHMLVDLAPEKSYQIKSSGQVLEAKKASSQGTLAFTTPAKGPQTIEVTGGP